MRKSREKYKKKCHKMLDMVLVVGVKWSYMKKVILRALGISTTLGVAGLIGTGLVVAEGEPQGGASTTFSVNIERMLEVTIPNEPTVPLVLDPSKDSQNLGKGISAMDISVNVATNNPTGYELYMYASNGSLVNNTVTPSATIGNLPSGKTFASSDVNAAWGFKLKSGSRKNGNTIVPYSTSEFATVPTGTNEFLARVTDGAGQSSATEFTFGVKVTDTNIKPGIYTGTINFMAVANEVPCDGVDIDGTCVVYMQDMTSALASKMVEEEQVQLKDKRDDKTYWVAKLADGNVWMTQNLQLINKTISSTDSDLASGSFTVPASAMWDDSIGYDTAGAYTENGETYYNWYTATAGTGTSSMTTAGTDAPGSICPKGWKLPKSGKVNGTSGAPRDLAGSFYNLWKSYITTGSWNASSAYWSGVTTSQFTSAPLSLAFSGYFGPWNGTVYGVGGDGYWWSSTVYGSGVAFYAYVGSGGGVNPASGDGRLNGNSVRCWAPGA